MSDLNEETKTVTVKKWTRSNKISVNNTYGSIPLITFGTEQARLEDGTLFSSMQGGDVVVAFNAMDVYPLLNPTDDSVLDPTGGSHTMLQLQLYSLFKYRMNQPVVVPEPIPIPVIDTTPPDYTPDPPPPDVPVDPPVAPVTP